MLSIVVVTLLSSCSIAPIHTIECITVEIPSIPSVPKLTPEQDASIPQDAYEILVERDQIKSSHIKRIHDIVDTHNSACK